MVSRSTNATPIRRSSTASRWLALGWVMWSRPAAAPIEPDSLIARTSRTSESEAVSVIGTVYGQYVNLAVYRARTRTATVEV